MGQLKNKITLTAQQLVELVGKAKANHLLVCRAKVNISKKFLRKITKALTSVGICTVKVMKSGRVEVVNPRFVEIKPRYSFEKKTVRAKSMQTRKVLVTADPLQEVLNGQ